MNEVMRDFAFTWPAWLGSPSQVALLVIVVISMIKIYPIVQKQVMDARFSREGRYGERIRHLESELTKCHEECTAKIEKLTAELHGMRDQRLSEQGAIMRAIVRMSDDPAVKKQLQLLEAMEIATNKGKEPVTYVGGPVDDAGDN